MTSVARLSPGSCQIQHRLVHNGFPRTFLRSDVLKLRRRWQPLPQITGSKRPKHRTLGVLHISAASVTERYEDAAAQDPIKPLRNPIAAWKRWWYIGATPRAELPKSQKFSRICARLWSIMKHSKTSLSFAVVFMVSFKALSILNAVQPI